MTAARIAAGVVVAALLGGEPRDDEAPSVRARLDRGIARAEAGDWSAALDEFVAARDAARHGEWECATFDWARALFERAASRELPVAPPPDASLPADVVANAKTSLAAARVDLVASRGGLLELLAREPRDSEAKSGLARVVAKLRDVTALEEAWRAIGTRPAAAAGAGESSQSGPLWAGPSATRGSAGAPGSRRGASEPGSGEAGGAGRSGAGNGGSNEGALTAAQTQQLLERLAELKSERRLRDERRAEATAAKSGRL